MRSLLCDPPTSQVPGMERCLSFPCRTSKVDTDKVESFRWEWPAWLSDTSIVLQAISTFTWHTVGRVWGALQGVLQRTLVSQAVLASGLASAIVHAVPFGQHSLTSGGWQHDDALMCMLGDSIGSLACREGRPMTCLRLEQTRTVQAEPLARSGFEQIPRPFF